MTVIIDHYCKYFLPSVRKMFSSAFGLEETFYERLAKNFNDVLDASDYLYIVPYPLP